MKKFVYLGYYIKTTNWSRFFAYINYTYSKYKISKIKLFLMSFIDAFRFKVSLEEYFMYSFYNKTNLEKLAWAGMGFMYEYHLMMSPQKYRYLLRDKSKFLANNKNFIKHKWVNVEDGEFSSMSEFLLNIKGKVVLKQVTGSCGLQVKIFNLEKTSVQEILDYAIKNNFTLAEEYIIQHPDLMKLSPSGLNTLRVVTQINREGNVDILAARIRITNNCEIDNLHAGNLAAAIDLNTGCISLPAVYSDITKSEESVHPSTQVPIVGFKIPYWQEVLESVKLIALHNKENRSVGWDVAITDKGVDFIEGNHDWNQDIFQMPVNQGLRGLLERYM